MRCLSLSYNTAIWTGWVCGCGHEVQHHTKAKTCTRCSCSAGYLDHQLPEVAADAPTEAAS